MAPETTLSASRVITAEGLGNLYRVLVAEGYRVIGPAVQDGAIVLRELSSATELPFGWGVRLGPGGYQLRRRDDTAAFGHSAGPQSWKQFLHPPRERLWSAARTPDGGFELSGEADEGEAPRYAFIGVRPCDLRAIAIQDRVLAQPGSRYAARRARLFIVAVNCTEPGETCFCASMGTGPGADQVMTWPSPKWWTRAVTASWPTSVRSTAPPSWNRCRASLSTRAPSKGRGQPLRRQRTAWAARWRSATYGS